MEDIILSILIMLITAGAYCWGYHSGLNRGSKLGLDAGKRLSPSTPEQFFSRTELPMRKIQCCYDVRITDGMHTEEIINHTTSAVYGMSTYLVQELLAHGLARPVFIDDERQARNIRRIGISFFVARDPAFDDYPDVVFLRRANSI